MKSIVRSVAAAVAVVAAASPACAAERIVAAGAAATEILWALGEADAVVGVDSTSTHPPEALASRPNVGYFRQLSAEGLLSLSPTLVIAVSGAGPRETLDAVASAGVKVAALDDDWTAEGVVAKIDRIGALTGRTEESRRLADGVAADFAALASARAARTASPRVLFVLALANGRPLVAGRSTAADAMIALAGGTNVVHGAFSGYRPLTDEAIVEAAPDVVVTMADGPEKLDADRLFATPAFAGTPAAGGRRLVAVEGADLVAFGPRTPAVARRLMEAFDR